MKATSFLGSLLAASSLLGGVAQAKTYDDMDPIVIKGSKFFYKNSGEQFFMKGVAYQQEIGPGGASSSANTDTKKRYTDPLTQVEDCKRDVPLLKELKTNIVRVYAIDPEGDHDECMELLAKAGIYLIADLSQPDQSVKSEDPSWNDDLYTRYTSVIDALQKYNNVMGFFAGNEVTHRANNTAASAFVKASVRDTKAYIKEKGYREMGVGYATNDDEEIRDQLLAFFNCGDEDESIDFWGYNIYSWCGKSSFTESGFDKHVEHYKEFNKPVFFAEYGCNKVTPRLFTEVHSIYGPDMEDVFSGGIVYMYHQEKNNYGLVEIKNGKAVKLKDFDNLKKEISEVTPKGVKMSDYKPENTKALECPAVDSVWQAKSSPLPPVVNPSLCKCMIESLSCSVADSVKEEEYGDLFGEVCGYGNDVCLGITHDATKGEYGAYSVCNPKEQLSFVMDRYYKSQNSRSDACDFDGAAEVQRSGRSSESCSSLMKDAGENGEATMVRSSSGDDDDGKASSNGMFGGVMVAVAGLSVAASLLA